LKTTSRGIGYLIKLFNVIIKLLIYGDKFHGFDLRNEVFLHNNKRLYTQFTYLKDVKSDSYMTRKIKICILSELAYSLLTGSGIRGGAELQMVILAKELVKRSYDVSFITFEKSDSSHEDINGIAVYNLFHTRTRGSTYLYPQNIYKLFKALKKIDADIYIQRAATR
jgi:hypothetical protein